MNFGLIARDVFQSLREDGAVTTVRMAMRYFLRRRRTDEFDLKNGTDTSGIEPLWKLSIRSANARFGTPYHASEEWEVTAALKLIQENFESFTFVDLGCGKGRVLMLVAQLGFKRVMGVEFAPELAATARKNINKIQLGDAMVIEDDAADFPFPPGNLVVFLFNPFKIEIVQRVVANLKRTAADKLYVVYTNPKHAEVFDGWGMLKRVGSAPGRWLPTIVWKMVAPRAEGASTQ